MILHRCGMFSTAFGARPPIGPGRPLAAIVADLRGPRSLPVFVALVRVIFAAILTALNAGRRGMLAAIGTHAGGDTLVTQQRCFGDRVAHFSPRIA
jgi:hypothetical protein